MKYLTRQKLDKLTSDNKSKLTELWLKCDYLIDLNEFPNLIKLNSMCCIDIKKCNKANNLRSVYCGSFSCESPEFINLTELRCFNVDLGILYKLTSLVKLLVFHMPDCGFKLDNFPELEHLRIYNNITLVCSKMSKLKSLKCDDFKCKTPEFVPNLKYRSFKDIFLV